jgi:hypothetical protein
MANVMTKINLKLAGRNHTVSDSEALVPQSFQSYTKSPNDFFLVATLVF